MGLMGRVRRVPAGTATHYSRIASACQLLAIVSTAYLPAIALSQPAFSCRTDASGYVCFFPPAVKYAVFGVYQGDSNVRTFGNTREEACIAWVAATPSANRGRYVGVRKITHTGGQPISGGPLYYCEFESNSSPTYDGDNRQIKVCPINSVMYDATGRYRSLNTYLPGALSMVPENAAHPMYYPSPLYPKSVMTIERGGALDIAMCASRSATVPTRNFGQPDGQSDGPTCEAVRGNPINIGAGVKTQTELDYGFGGELRLIRTYNSGAGTDYFSGALGKGWQHNYGLRLSISNVVTSFRGNGRIVEFAPNGSNWSHWPDVNDQLTELKNSSDVRTGWKYVSATNDVEVYDPGGTLVSITSRMGNTTTLTYSDGTGRGNRGGVIEGTSVPLPASLLLRVTNTFGLVLSFGYDSNYRIVRVTRPDGNNHRYQYGSGGNLASVTYPDQSGDKIRTYLYESASFSNALTGIIDEKADRHSTYGYDQFGLATSTQLAGNANRYALAFNGDGTTSSQRTRLKAQERMVSTINLA